MFTARHSKILQKNWRKAPDFGDHYLRSDPCEGRACCDLIKLPQRREKSFEVLEGMPCLGAGDKGIRRGFGGGWASILTHNSYFLTKHDMESMDGEHGREKLPARKGG